MDPFVIERIDPLSDLRYEGELDLRYRVLRAPLGLGRHEVRFDGESAALHLVATEKRAGEDVVVGCVLFVFASGRLRAMAVDPSRQRRGVGAALVRRLEGDVRLEGVRGVRLHARADAVGFYARLGYATYGEAFTEVGLVHRHMQKTLRQAPESPP